MYIILASINSNQRHTFTGGAHEATQKSNDVSWRYQSLRSNPKNQRVFRASDLIHGEVLGKGFFGQVTKVRKLHYVWYCTRETNGWIDRFIYRKILSDKTDILGLWSYISNQFNLINYEDRAHHIEKLSV